MKKHYLVFSAYDNRFRALLTKDDYKAFIKQRAHIIDRYRIEETTDKAGIEMLMRECRYMTCSEGDYLLFDDEFEFYIEDLFEMFYNVLNDHTVFLIKEALEVLKLTPAEHKIIHAYAIMLIQWYDAYQTALYNQEGASNLLNHDLMMYHVIGIMDEGEGD